MRRSLDSLEILKSLLIDDVGPEVGVPLQQVAGGRGPIAGALGRLLAAALAPFGLGVVVRPESTAALRDEGRGWPGRALTMVGRRRLDQLQHAIETVIDDGVPGDILEAGVWRGGASLFARAVLAERGVTDRRVLVADSFRGLPAPAADCHPSDRGDRHAAIPYLAVSRAEVEANFERFGLLDDQVVFVEGWFAESLSRAPVDALAILRVDADLYGSTMEVLSALYDAVSPGGFVIIDDLALDGCRRAVEDFRAGRGIQAPIIRIDWTGGWWRKGAGPC
jgi:O-methyltransferase